MLFICDSKTLKLNIYDRIVNLMINFLPSNWNKRCKNLSLPPKNLVYVYNDSKHN